MAMKETAKELYAQAAILEGHAKVLREAASFMERAIRISWGNGAAHRTQTERLMEFLNTRHGATRRQMREESGLPEGTIASLLGARKRFAVDKKTMLWHPVDARKLA
jgi:hypothetical protein